MIHARHGLDPAVRLDRRDVAYVDEPDLKLIMVMAQKMAGERNRRVSAEA